MSDATKDTTGQGAQQGHDSSQPRSGRVIAFFSVLGVLVAIVALARDFSGFEFASDTPATTRSSPTDAASPTSAPTVSSAPATNGKATSLTELTVVAGRANLGKLPHTVATDPAYEGSLVINCPTNAGADRQREVNLRLQRRYLALRATVRPYFADRDFRDAKAFVYAQVAVKESDGTITRVTRGAQFDARMATPMGLQANVEGADELILRVECQFPGGYVIITGAELTSA